MPFNVSEFSSQVNRHGLAVTNLFVLNIAPPSTFGNVFSPRDLPFFCRSVDLPDLNVNIMEAKPYSIGALQAFPMGMSYDQLACEFMLDLNMNILKFFERWIQLIYNYDSSGGPMSAVNGMNPSELNYKRDYVGTIEVYMYSSHDYNNVHKITYYDAFPINVKLPQLAWNNTAELAILPIQFRFSSIKYEGAITGQVDNSAVYRGINFGNNTYGNLLDNNDIPNFIKEINNVKKLVNSAGDLLNKIF